MVAWTHCFYDVAPEPPDCVESGKRRCAVHLHPVLNSSFLLETLAVIPVCNERASIRDVVPRVEAVDYDREIIRVDGCSADGSREIREDYKDW